MKNKGKKVRKCQTIRGSILRNFTILSFFMSFAFVVAFIVVGFVQSTLIFNKITNDSIVQAERGLKQMITPIETSLKIVSKLSKIEYFKDLNSQNINHVLIPVFNDFPQISSFKIMGQDGSGYVLYKSAEGWMAGKKGAGMHSNMVQWFQLGHDFEVAKEHHSNLPFHMGKSKWYKQSVKSKPNKIIWSNPHILPYLNTLGVTVSLPIVKESGEIYVFAFDVELVSFSKVLTEVEQKHQGTHFLITEDKSFMILANELIYNSDTKKMITPKGMGKVEFPSYLLAGIEEWEEEKLKEKKRGPHKIGNHKSQLFFYDHDEQNLIGNMKHVSSAVNLEFWAGVILDEDKNVMIKRDSKYLMTIPVILCLALIIAFVMAHSMTKKYTVPIRRLVENSTKIAKLELSETDPIQSPIVELQQLADTQEIMRVELKNATGKLEEWGNTCSLQVIERTKEVEAKSIELEKVNAELEKLNKNLEKRVAEEVKASSQKDKIMFQSARQAQMGEMLSMIAHQWRQPLSSISTITGSMLVYLELGTFDQDQFKELLTDINNHAQYLSGTINDFRNFFKPNKDKQPAILPNVMDQSVNIIGKSLEYKSIKINRNYHEVSEIYTFPNELMQVFLNIIKNAQDVILERKIEAPEIHLEILEENDHQIVRITDNAGGIAEEYIEKVFEPYFSTKDEKTGTGLGLYMSKLILEKHCDGELTVTNTDQGAQFMMRIPINTKEENAGS